MAELINRLWFDIPDSYIPTFFTLPFGIGFAVIFLMMILIYKWEVLTGNVDTSIVTRAAIFEVEDIYGIEGVPYTNIERRSDNEREVSTSLLSSPNKLRVSNLSVSVFRGVDIKSFQALLQRGGRGFLIDSSCYDKLEQKDVLNRCATTLMTVEGVELTENGRRMKYPTVVLATNKTTETSRISIIHDGDSLERRPYIIAEFLHKDDRLWRLQPVYSESGDPECSVCLDQSASVILLPCRHKQSCYNCTQRLTVCPICRTEISCYFNTQARSDRFDEQFIGR